MPNWKKVVTSGSNASLNTLTVTNGVTGNVIGTSSYATSASRADSVLLPGSGGGEILFNTGGVLSASNRIYISSNVLYATNGGTVSITGSLQGTASFATTASYALTAQTLLGSVTSASFATTASFVTGSIFTNGNKALSASYAVTSSFAPTAGNISAAVSLFNYYNFT